MSTSAPKSIRWHKAALRDLEEIVAFIAQDKPDAAERFAASVFAKVEMLSTSPCLGAVCPHYRTARQLLHGSYLIYYTVANEEIVVRAVVHGARLFRRKYWLNRKGRRAAPRSAVRFRGFWFFPFRTAVGLVDPSEQHGRVSTRWRQAEETANIIRSVRSHFP